MKQKYLCKSLKIKKCIYYLYISIFLLPLVSKGQETLIHEADCYFSYVDTKSNIWLGTSSGITKISGDHRVKYRANPRKENGLQESLMQSEFYEDRSGDIWFTTVSYLNRYNSVSDDFNHFGLTDSSSYYRIVDFYADSIFILQVDETIVEYNTRSGSKKKTC